MTKRWGGIGWAVLASLALGGTAWGADFNLKVTTAGIQLGKPVLGPKLTADDLKGRVVLLEFWGINCGPCLASLPHVAQLNEELSPFGLVVIGAHAQKGTPAEIQAKAQSRGVNFAVVTSASVKDGHDFNGIPHCMLFDHTGQCLYRGSPGGAETPLRAAVGKALVEDLSQTSSKAVGALVDALKKGQSPKTVLQKAIPLQRSSDGKTASEAKQLVAALTRFGQKRVEEAEALKKDDPVAAYFLVQRVPALFKGTPVETQANTLLAELKRTKAVAAELQARPSLDKVKKLDNLLSARAGNADPKGAEFQRAFGPTLKQMQVTLQQMKKSWPEAKATQEAIEIGDKYGVTLR